MKLSKRIAYSSLLLIAVFVIRVNSVSAQGVQDFVVETFDVKYELNNSDPQGRLITIEKIAVDFSGQNRGLLRAVPARYGDVDTNPRILSVLRDGAKEPYTTYTENNNTVIRIGDPEQYLTGKHTYEISYQVDNVIRFYDTHDELFWDINGDEWQQPFLQVSAEIKAGVLLTEPLPVCYTGFFGSTDSDCDVATENDGFRVNTTRELLIGETLTVVGAFEKGYFTEPSFYEKYRNYIVVSPIVALQLLAVRSAHTKWKRYGKDIAKRRITVPYFERPKHMSVMQAGYIQNNSLTPQHITANIIDLAIRGFITITEKKERFSTKHDLTLIKPTDASLREEEKLLITELFSSDTAGSMVRLEDKKNKLFSSLQKLAKVIDEQSIKTGFYELSPMHRGKYLVRQLVYAGLLLFVGLLFAEYSNGLTAVGGVVALLAIVVYNLLMTKRSLSGTMVVEHMQGLKLYLNQAEKDRIKNQDAVAAPLSPRSGEPLRDVKFFEKLLPYAVAMGVEKTWAKAFANIYTQPPDWYSGNWKTFSAIALADSLTATGKATATSFSAPSSSSGSGFSGGGSAGGGGGGGGGGGW